VRLLLDAHLSASAVGTPLRERGHDVRAVDEERALDGAADERLLALATAEERIMVTFDADDFARLTRIWAGGGRHHAGCLIFVGIDHSEFGLTLRVIDSALAARPEQQKWRDHVAWGTRAAAT